MSEIPHICADCRTQLMVTPPRRPGCGFDICIFLAGLVLIVGIEEKAWMAITIGSIAVALCIAALLPGRLWRRPCPRCGSRRLIPIDTPAGKELNQ